MAPCGLTIARTLRTEAQVICARSKENVSVLRYFMTPTRGQKAFSRVSFGEITGHPSVMSNGGLRLTFKSLNGDQEFDIHLIKFVQCMCKTTCFYLPHGRALIFQNSLKMTSNLVKTLLDEKK